VSKGADIEEEDARHDGGHDDTPGPEFVTQEHTRQFFVEQECQSHGERSQEQQVLYDVPNHLVDALGVAGSRDPH
jgi:hypothetical protein